MTIQKESITTVVFDADFTLWAPDYFATCELVGRHLGVPRKYLHKFTQELVQSLYEFIPLIGCNVVTTDLLLKHLDTKMHSMFMRCNLSADEVIHELMNPKFACCKVNPDALDSVMYLWVNNYRQILKSNWWIEVQIVQLRKFGLFPFFESFYGPIWSYFKPHAEGADFLKNNNPEHYLMVGDSIEYDIKFAKNTGMHSAWFNPGGISNTSDIKPDITISRLSELTKIL